MGQFAIIGAGDRSYLGQVISKVDPTSRVTDVVDPFPSGRERARAMFGDDVRLHDTVTDLLAARHTLSQQLDGADKLDGALVTSPDAVHAEQARELLRAGVTTYLEKPMAITTEDADDLLRLADETGTRLFVGHNMRFMGVVTIMKRLIDEGRIGRVQAIWCRHFVGFGGDAYFRDWHAEQRYGNTLLLQKGAHDLDVIHHLAGAYTERVQAFGRLAVYGDTADRNPSQGLDWVNRRPMTNWPPRELTGLNAELDMEDLAQVNLQLAGGILASYQQCHFTPDYWRNYTVIGDLGRIENQGDGEGGVVRLWNRRVNSAYEPDEEFPITGDAGGHLDADEKIISEFLDYAFGRIDETRVPSIAARHAVATGVAAAWSMRNGGVPVDVS